MKDEEYCEHIWEEMERQERLKSFHPAGFFKQGAAIYEDRILQRCKKCGIYHVVNF